jgi:AcrR family transcriptional regulator
MIEAVARYGYEGTKLSHLVALAGVSNTTFYEQFETIEQCFLATFDEIVARASKQVGQAYRSKTDFEDRLRAAFEAYVDFVIAEPAANSLVLVDSLALGSAGVAHRNGAAEAFDLMYRQSFDQAP